jgi:hypothetical protein
MENEDSHSCFRARLQLEEHIGQFVRAPIEEATALPVPAAPDAP